MIDNVAQWIWGIGALMLVGSSLFARQMPVSQWLKMLLAWVAIFGVAFVLFLFRDEGRVVWQRATAEITGRSGETVGTTLRIRQADDGHFWVRASVNGRPTDFMIDSGATMTTLTQATAAAAGVTASGGFPVLVETANGTVETQRARIEKLTIGPITQNDAAVLIGADTMGDTSLLGMSFLSTLKSWRVERRTLILEPE